jgi:hypothetical protein
MTATTTDLPADLHVTLDRVADALTAIFTGDPAPYAALWAPGTQPTLFGAWGPTEKGHDAVVTTFDWVASRFSDGIGCRPRYKPSTGAATSPTPSVTRRSRSASTADRRRR